ncbi:unnamed protein product [Prunus armeniaca]
MVACRRCGLLVGLSNYNWASFLDLGSCSDELERDLGEFVLCVEEKSCRASQGPVGWDQASCLCDWQPRTVGAIVAAGGCCESIRRKLVVWPLPRMLRDGSRMVQTLLTCQLGRRSVLPDTPVKKEG